MFISFKFIYIFLKW